MTKKNRGCRQEVYSMDWVVVVDDDITNLKMAGRILSKNNMRVTALKSGTALLDYIKTNKPDLILLDIKMPGLDGFETMKRLQQQMNPSEKIPVIFLTADDSQDAETHGLALGAMDFIKKPFIPDVLVPHSVSDAAGHFPCFSGTEGIRHLRQHGSGQGSRRRLL